MRIDYITEAQDDIREFNKTVRQQQDATLSLKNHLEKVRDKLTQEIDRLNRLASSLGQIAAENGTDDVKAIGSKPEKLDFAAMERDLKRANSEDFKAKQPNNAA